MSPEEAFIGVLACAVAADRHHRTQELELIELVVNHHRYTRDIDENSYRESVARVRANVSARGALDSLDDYCDVLPPEWQGAVFLWALDLIFIDGHSDGGEIEFIEKLAKRFEIADDSLEYFTNVFKEKNAVG